MDIFDSAREMVSLTHIKIRQLRTVTLVEKVFLLYCERMLGQVEGAVALLHREDTTSSAILTRSALECYVDLCNLSLDDRYMLVLETMLLEDRSAVFHYKTPPLYDDLIKELGEKKVKNLGKQVSARFKDSLKRASDAFPIFGYNPRKINVINRFKLAKIEARYHTEYSYLSMQVHNSLDTLLLADDLKGVSSHLDDAQEGMSRAMLLHIIIEILVDTHKCIIKMFGHDSQFTRDFMNILQELSDIN